MLRVLLHLGQLLAPGFVFSRLLWQIFFQLGRKENVLTANWKEAPAWPRKLAVDVTFCQIFIYHQVRRP